MNQQQSNVHVLLGKVVGVLRAEERELRAEGVRKLSIVGSLARGDAAEDSDIDISIEIDPHAHLGLRFFALEERLRTLLGHPVQLLSEPAENPRLRANVQRDRVIVF
jgi:uncharacterized protein